MEDKYESTIPQIMYDQRVTRRDLERGAGVSYDTAKRMEKGEINFKLFTLFKVAEFFKTPWVELIKEIEPESKKSTLSPA